MIEKQGTITNTLGIHCRPAEVIRKAVADYAGDVEIINAEGIVANPRKILSILSLALCKGESFTVRVTGPQEEELCNKLVELLETAFDFSR